MFREGGSLLKVGVVLAVVAVVLVICATVVGVGLRGEPGRLAVAAGAVKGSVGEVYRSVFGSPFGEEAGANGSPPGQDPGENPGKGPGEDESQGYSSGDGSPEQGSHSRSGEAAKPKSESAGQQGSSQDGQGDQHLPAAENSQWPKPTPQEIRRANSPRHYELLPGAVMGLTIEAIGIYDAPVFDSDGPEALANGVAHVPGTSWPWSPTPQRNVYLAGHRMGFRGTWSRMLFYNLDKLQEGDKVVLRDRSGGSYEYRVSEVFLAEPTDSWVMGQVRGRDMVTLQTCTPLYTFEKRLIVRADRV